MGDTDTNKDCHITGLEIAVIGMAGRFPGARNIDEFWENLKQGVESITFFSDKELEETGVDPEQTENSAYVKAEPLLEDIDCFDAIFFEYTPREAELMDPQLRILHECAWEALEDAGYDPNSYSRLIGFYAGAAANIEWLELSFLSGKVATLGNLAAQHLMDRDFLSTRIAHRLNLRGPAITVQTACSTSLVAVHLASQGLLSGDCDMVLAGGVTVAQLKKQGYIYQEGMIASPDGHCRAFDANAKGTVFGNGVGLVVLKRLNDAIEDGNHIYAVIKGSAINNDGITKANYTAPGIYGQEEVIRTALQMAEVEPESISYVETHGTGTPLGDPVEIEGLKQAFNTNKEGFCALGSLKTNVGHLDIAAGIAGFIKTVLALKHGLLPPTLHYNTPNPKIDFENSSFYVNTEAKEWKNDKYPLRAGVSSFGIGGTNVHVVLQEWRKSPSNSPGSRDQELEREYQLILLSAKSESALDQMTLNLATYFKKNPGLNPTDAAFTLQVGRAAFPHRRMTVCSSINEALENLSNPGSGKVHTFLARKEKKTVVFLFPGLGSQYVNMGLELYQKQPVFQEKMDRCFEILKPLLGYDLKEILYPGEAARAPGHTKHTKEEEGTHHSSFIIDNFEVAQVVIFIFEYALACLLMKWGIKPGAMIGYSFGEYTAACISGVLSLEDSLKVVAARGQLIQKMPKGSMLSVPLEKEQLIPLLKENPGCSLAIDNGPSSIVSGPPDAINAFETQMKQKKLMCLRVQVSHALHSDMMTPILREFEKTLGSVTLNQPRIPYISNVTGTWIKDQEALDPDYWTRHLGSTVQFADGIRELLNQPNCIFLEMGPGRDISTLALRHIENDGNRGHQVLNLVKTPHQKIPDALLLLNRIGKLWLYGQPIDWSAIYSNKERRRIPLPTYPFAGQRFRIEDKSQTERSRELSGPSRTREIPDFANWFYVPNWTRSMLPLHNRKDSLRHDNYLVFLEDEGTEHEHGPGSLMVQRLRQEGHKVITVTKGTEFTKRNTDTYTMNPQHMNHYDTLFDQLSSRGDIPQRLVHLWGITGTNGANDANSESSLWEQDWTENMLELGFYSLIGIARAIGRKLLTELPRVFVVTSQVQEVTGEEWVCPGKATVLGPVRVIPQEFPGIRCRSIDIVLPKPGSKQEETLVNQLVKEVSADSNDSTVAYRGNFRWIQLFNPIRLEQGLERPSVLRERGVYLVTGGLGNIGMILAEYLGRKVKAKLILTDHSVFPPRDEWDQWMVADHNQNQPKITSKIKQLKALEEAGAKVLVFSADAADKKQMQKVLVQAEQAFGPVNGLLHCAGVMKGRSLSGIRELEKNHCQEQFQPKIHGLLVLKELFQDKELDFCWLMSSISTVLGGLGLAAYAAANCFMDVFVKKHNRFKRKKWISVDWDGMSREQTQTGFLRILSLDDVDQVLASNGGNIQERIDQWVKLESLSSASHQFSQSHQPRPDLLTPYVPPKNQQEQSLAAIWQRIFGFQQVGNQDDFIELGGDSLRAITMLNQVHTEFDVLVPLGDFFKTPTLEWLAGYILDAEKVKFHSIAPAEKKEYYPLSEIQKRMYILNSIETIDTAYNIPIVMMIQGKPNRQGLQQAIQRLIQRYEILRTTINVIKLEPVQIIHKQVDFYIEFIEAEKNDIEKVIKQFIRPFKLSKAPLLRVGLITLSEEKHMLVFDIHHIITDGSSTSIMIQDFAALYKDKELPGLRIQYKDFSEWKKSEIGKQKTKKQEEYWLNRFKGEIPRLELYNDYPRPPVQSFAGEMINFNFDQPLISQLDRLEKKTGTTLYMILLAAFTILLAKFSGQEDIIVGSPIAGRDHVEIEKIPGLFINVLALRNYPTGNKKFKEFLYEVKENTLKAYENQGYPFGELIKKLGLTRDISRNPLYDAELIVQNIEWPISDMGELTFTRCSYDPKVTQHDISLMAVEVTRGISFHLSYCTRLFKRETIEKFIEFFKIIISIVVEDIDIKLEDIAIPQHLEKAQLNIPQSEKITFGF